MKWASKLLVNDASCLEGGRTPVYRTGVLKVTTYLKCHCGRHQDRTQTIAQHPNEFIFVLATKAFVHDRDSQSSWRE